MNPTTILILIIGIYLIIGVALGIRAAYVSPMTRKLPRSTVIIGFIMYAAFWIPMQYAVRKSRKDKE